jgi:hypothetical protein
MFPDVLIRMVFALLTCDENIIAVLRSSKVNSSDFVLSSG